MCRLLALIVGSALLVGCASTSGTTAPQPSAGKPGASYFEVPGDKGMVYVFGSTETMADFVENKSLPAMSTEYINGKPVMVEQAELDRLSTAYKAAHK